MTETYNPSVVEEVKRKIMSSFETAMGKLANRMRGLVTAAVDIKGIPFGQLVVCSIIADKVGLDYEDVETVIDAIVTLLDGGDSHADTTS